MAAQATRVKVTYQGPYALEFSVTFYVAAGVVDPNDAGIQAIVSAINAITRAVAIRIEVSASNPSPSTPTANAVYVNEDKAEFVFNSSSGNGHTFKLPGLDPAILGTDNETIPSTGAVATFLAAVAANATDADGGALAAPAQGRRRAARKTLKK